MKPKSPRVVELFNEALTLELTVINTYFLNARMLDNWGFPRLGKVFYDLSIDEMKDADAIIQRIIFLDGHPNVQRLKAIQIGENAVEMMELARDGEYGAISSYNDAAKECHDLGDHASGSTFEAMALDEEHHADYFEGQLDAIMRVGLENYLAAQMSPGQGP